MRGHKGIAFPSNELWIIDELFRMLIFVYFCSDSRSGPSNSILQGDFPLQILIGRCQATGWSISSRLFLYASTPLKRLKKHYGCFWMLYKCGLEYFVVVFGSFIKIRSFIEVLWEYNLCVFFVSDWVSNVLSTRVHSQTISIKLCQTF